MEYDNSVRPFLRLENVPLSGTVLEEQSVAIDSDEIVCRELLKSVTIFHKRRSSFEPKGEVDLERRHAREQQRHPFVDTTLAFFPASLNDQKKAEWFLLICRHQCRGNVSGSLRLTSIGYRGCVDFDRLCHNRTGPFLPRIEGTARWKN